MILLGCGWVTSKWLESYTLKRLFFEYIGFIAELVPGSFDIKILDYIADDSGVALRMKGDGEGRYGDYDDGYFILESRMAKFFK